MAFALIRTLIPTLALCSICMGFIQKPNEPVLQYDCKNPVIKLTLPDTLREISGLTYIDSVTVACVQDENGIVFLYDLSKNRIKRQFTFNINGDYEGITRVNTTLYILRSDGMLFEVSDYESKKFTIKAHSTGIPALNNEGLCFDKDNNRLLIGCKGKIDKGPQYKDIRQVYEFDLGTKKLNPKPVFNFNINTIKTFALEKNIRFPSKTTKSGKSTGPFIKLNTSEIAIHPISKQLFLLSASDYCLFVFNLNGTLEHIEKLDPLVFNKAEGITFFPNGDMLISNEGQSKKPTLLRFNYLVK